jgi:hypothetical protein
MMRSVAELLERESTTVDLEGDHFERMLRRRDRKRQNQRFAVYTLVAAFVVAGIVIGIDSLRSDDDGTIGGPPATPTAMPTGTPIPSLPEGALEPGTYIVHALDHEFDAANRITISVPDGYEGIGGFLVLKLDGTSNAGVSLWAVGNLYADPCDWTGTLLDPPVGSSVSDLAAALVSQRGFHVSTPTDITIDGFAGTYMERTAPAGTNLADCFKGEYRTWVATDGGARWVVPGELDLLWIVDVDGAPLVIDAELGAGATAQVRAELIRIVESIRIDPR